MIQQKQLLAAKVKEVMGNGQRGLDESLNETFFKYLFTPDFYDLLNELLKNKEVWYIRHAESPINEFFSNADNFGKPYFKDEKYYDPSITQKGYTQLASLPILSFDIAYISPMTRTMQTFSNLNIRLRKRPIVTPLIRQKTKILAGLVGTPKEKIQSNYPDYLYQWNLSGKYWWRSDKVDEPYLNIVQETPESFKARIALFLLWILLEGSLNILVVSHMAFYTAIYKPEYYEQPANAKLELISHEYIIRLFKRIQKRVSPKL